MYSFQESWEEMQETVYILELYKEIRRDVLNEKCDFELIIILVGSIFTIVK